MRFCFPNLFPRFSVLFLAAVIQPSLDAVGPGEKENAPKMPHGTESSFRQLPDPVATIHGEPLSRDAFANMLEKRYGMRFYRMPKERLKWFLTTEIRQRLLREEADRRGIQVTEPEIRKALEQERVKQEANPENAGLSLEQLLEEHEMDLDTFKKEQIIPNLRIARLVEADITEAACRDYFAQHREKFDHREVRARHILVTGTGEKSLKKLQEVQARLEADGSNFAELARQYSNCRSKRRGGDLGFLSARPKDPVIRAIFTLKKGEIAGPIRSTYGYHLVQVTDIRGAAPSYESALPEIRTQVANQMVKRLLSRLWQAAAVRIPW